MSEALKPRRLKSFRRPILEDDVTGEKRMLCRFHLNGCPFSFKLDRNLPENKARRKGTSACWNHEERDCRWNEDKLTTVPKPKRTRVRDDEDEDDDDASMSEFGGRRKQRATGPRPTRASKAAVNFREESSDENVYEYDEEEPMDEEELPLPADYGVGSSKSPRIKTSAYSMPPTPPNSTGPTPHGAGLELLGGVDQSDPGVRSLLLSADDTSYMERMTMAIQNVERKLDRLAGTMARRIGLMETRMVSIESEIQNVTEGQYARDRRIEDLVNLTRGLHGVYSTGTSSTAVRHTDAPTEPADNVAPASSVAKEQSVPIPSAESASVTFEMTSFIQTSSAEQQPAATDGKTAVVQPPPTTATVSGAHPALPDLTPEMFEEEVQSSFQVGNTIA